MFKEVALNDPHGNKIIVPMLANAATPIRFKMIFGSDILSGIITTNGDLDMDIVSKLGYLMAQQAANSDMNALNMSSYVDWLEGFDSMAFIDNAQDIFDVFVNSKKNSSKAKK